MFSDGIGGTSRLQYVIRFDFAVNTPTNGYLTFWTCATQLYATRPVRRA